MEEGKNERSTPGGMRNRGLFLSLSPYTHIYACIYTYTHAYYSLISTVLFLLFICAEAILKYVSRGKETIPLR